MRWHFKKLDYDILIPPLEKSIFQLSESETASYFEWFIQMIPQRIAYLNDTCAHDLRISVDRLDLSPESLSLLWRWFRSRAETEPLVQASEMQGQNTLPIDKHQIERQLTLQTEYILRDVGMYLGETFIKNHDNIFWTYYTKPRRDFFVNHPLLKGFVDRSFDPPFEMCFEPIHMARVQATKILKRKSHNTDLLNLYLSWAARI